MMNDTSRTLKIKYVLLSIFLAMLVIVVATAVLFCEFDASNNVQKAASWDKRPLPSGFAKTLGSIKWLAATGTKDGLYTVSPLATPGQIITPVDLDIDCYIVGLAINGKNIFVAGVRSRGALDSPSGIYQVELIEKGISNTKLLLPSELYGGIDVSALFSYRSEENIVVIACSGREAYWIRAEHEEPQVVSKSTLIRTINRWAHLGNGVLCGQDSSGRLYIVERGKVPSKLGSGAYGELALSSIDDTVILRSEGEWSAWHYSDVKKSISKTDRLTVCHGWAPTALELSDGSIVMVVSSEMPYQARWCVNKHTLITPNMNVFQVDELRQ